MDRVLCPLHSEQTPSCVLYETHAWCFGGCGRVELAQLGLTPEDAPPPKPKEDLGKSIREIRQLPVKDIRGMSLHYDDRGYYIVWQGGAYYKRRNWSGEPKYKNPAGHGPQPLFVVRDAYSDVLYLAEGELNAMSIAAAVWDDVVSPGSASNFLTKSTQNWLTTLGHYSKVVIVVDRDAAGVGAAIATKAKLMHIVPTTTIVLMDEDPNQIHVERGLEALRLELEKKEM
jgi:hypothetical protein